VELKSASVLQGETRPPRAHNDASILRSMEIAGRKLEDKEVARAMRGAGLGTPATRASILQTLLDRGYIVRDVKDLRATPKGFTLVDAVPVAELKSAALTGEWEGRLTQIAEGSYSRAAFVSEVHEHVRRIVDSIRANPPPAVAGDVEPQTAALGSCPACGLPVRRRRQVWECDAGRACSFVVFSTMSTRKISDRMVRQLLKSGQTAIVKGFKSKQGKPFEAALRWDVDAGRVGFVFPPRVGDRCPSCGAGKIIRGRAALGCNRWREGCSYTSALK